MVNPIDRALDKYCDSPPMSHEELRPILDDLVAELDERWQNLKLAVRLEDFAVMRDRAEAAEARLTAVRVWCEKWEKDGESYVPISSVLALVRGEGGSDE